MRIFDRLIDKTEVLEFITDDAKDLLSSLDLIKTTESTNYYLYGFKPNVKADICISEQQTNGKGRRNNSWESKGYNITFSIKWHFAKEPDKLSSLAIVVSLIIASVLDNLNLSNIKVKWPNDLIIDSKKVGGILVENHPNSVSPYVIIGIGLNYFMDNSNTINQDWTDLYSHEIVAGRSEIIGKIISKLLPVLSDFNEANILGSYWHKYDWVHNQEVLIINSNNVKTGIARGINSDGGLLVDIVNKHGKLEQEIFHSGDVSLRKK